MRIGVELIAEERQRQIEKEGWSASHDVEHKEGQLSDAAACYCLSGFRETVASIWPWDQKWWKPTPENRIRELQKAGALIAAEIDRLQAAQ